MALALPVVAEEVVVMEAEATEAGIVVEGAVPGTQPAVSPAASAATPATTPEDQAAAAAAATPNGEKKGEGTEEKKEDEDREGKGAGGGSLPRPTKPPKPADPKELEARPDEHNRIEFSFNGQPWPDVLQWLAGVSGYSLDWQELPSDYLNLSTQHSYTLPEARNLINSRLRDRGYTMLLSGDVLSVVKIAKVDPSLVPRATEEELYDLQPFDMVKLSLELPANADVAAMSEDIKKVLSEHAKVVPLPATRRVLVIDAVANLRMVSSLLNEERLAAEGKIVPTEFILKHRRAEKVIDILYVILGLDPATQPSQMDLQIQQQKLALIQQMAGQGKDVTKMLKDDAPPVYIAFNAQRNSLLVNAPAEQLKIIERSVSLLDVPTASETLASSGVAADLAERIAKSYKLESIDPKSLLSTLEEIGDLSPMAELRADSGAKILFCRCSVADHAKIEKMIEQLDGQHLETVVFQLRKHPADAVAGTLRDLFAPKKEEKNSNDFGYGYYYSPWEWESMNRNNKEERVSELRVDADVENNRLFVRGSEKDLEQVRDFLAKIGESTDQQPRAERVRMMESLDPETTLKLLERLRSTWPAVGDNPLIIRGPSERAPATELRSTPPATEEKSDRAAERGAGRTKIHYAVEQSPGMEPATGQESLPPARSAPEVVISITPDGRLLLSSEDTMALDRLEQLIEDSVPQQRRFEVYQIKHVRASSIYLTLTGLYKEEIKGETPERRWDWRTDSWVTTGSKSESQLSRRKLLKIDYDFNSNTLLVANATPQQQQEIEELIKEYDKPSSEDAQSRRIAAIKVEYSRATVIAAALKEVYRDLLSQRDKEFEKDEKSGTTIPKESTTILRFGGPGEAPQEGERERPAEIGFQGALSVGVDEVSNTIIVSAQEEVFDSVVEIIKALDQQAKPTTTVDVRSVNGGISANALQKALAEALGTPWVGDRPEDMFRKEPQQEPNGQQNPQQPPEMPGGAQPASQPALQIE